MTEAENQLRNYQRQLDADGIMVGVSRQAIDEVLAEIERLRAIVAHVETWVCNPAASYSVMALDGLFGATREMISLPSPLNRSQHD